MISALSSIASRIISGADHLTAGNVSGRHYPDVVCYLEDMPDYLRRDIGLPEDADLIEAVERGIVQFRRDNDVTILSQPIPPV